MRQITTHHDGHGLNDIIELVADDQDPNAGGASHRYTAAIRGRRIIDVQFQHGPRDQANSIEGATEAALLAILIDRMEGFQAGTFPARENALVKTKCEEALHWTRHRADERARRGVLGKNQK